jgi:hypothetical protein
MKATPVRIFPPPRVSLTKLRKGIFWFAAGVTLLVLAVGILAMATDPTVYP